MYKDRVLKTIFIVDSIGEHRGLHYHNFPLSSELSYLGLRVVLLSTPETCVHELLPNNIETRGIFKAIYGDKSKIIRGINYIFALIKLIYLAFKEKPQIIHFHFFQIPILDLISILILRVFNFSIISSIHDILPLHLKFDVNKFSASIYKLIYKYSTGLNVHSNYVYRIILELYPNFKSKTFLTPLGNYLGFHSFMSSKYRLSQCQAKVSIGLSEIESVLLIFGTIKPNKRLDWVIESFYFVVKHHKHTRLVIVGSLQDRTIDREVLLTKKLGLENNVIFRLEKISDEDLFIYLTAADIVVFPYEYIYQSAGIIMAMSFGKPIIVTDVGSNSELIQSGKTGLVIDMKKPMELAHAINHLLINHDEAREMGYAAFDFVQQHYSWKKIAEKTLYNYQRISNRFS